MSTPRQRPYEFRTAEQWNSCLFAGAAHEGRDGLHPHAPLTRLARRLASNGASAPAVNPAGDLFWRDDAGHLLRACADAEWPESFVAPVALAQARRMVVTHDSIWAPGTAPGTLEVFHADGLERRLVLTLPGVVVDVAGDTQGGILVLVVSAGVYSILRVDCGGEVSTLMTLRDLAPTHLANLPLQSRIVLLDEQGRRLVALTRDGRAEWKLRLAAHRPCFAATSLSSDGRGRLFLVGADGTDFGSIPHALVLDADGMLIDALQLARPATGIAGGRGVVVISDAQGIAIHTRATVAGDSAPVAAHLITPLLRAPQGDIALRWQRADAWAYLPEGSTLEVRYGWTGDRKLAARARAMQTDARLSETQRLQWLAASIDHWSAPVSFAGGGEHGRTSDVPLSFPLHDARTEALWLHVTLRATPRSALPSLSRLTVSYAGSDLLEQLPACYRRTALVPGDFLGALVGVLEATSQNLDQRIAALDSLVHPDTAPERWMDELAGWLGLPWDDALSVAQKSALLKSAGTLAAQRGTRAGLATLLACLFPGTPAPFRISDIDVDYGFATLGGGECRGSMLPAVLAGLPDSATVLSRRTILGRACLPQRGAAAPSSIARLAGLLRVDIHASAAAQRAARPYLARLIDSIVPAHLRVDLRWRTPARDRDADGAAMLAPAPLPHLGNDAITGFARLPRRPDSNLSS